MAEQLEFDEQGIRRNRRRKSEGKFKNEDIANRVVDFVKQDSDARVDDTELRLQRYAKFRMWTDGGDDWPWEGSSDIGLPDIMTDVLSLEDTLHNAVMSNRPIANARAVQKVNADKEDLVDDLIDTQMFVEQQGEKAVEEAASAFVMDGVTTAYVPWVREDRKVSIFRSYKGLEPNELPIEKFTAILGQEFAQHQIFQLDEQGWDWELIDPEGQKFGIKFYTSKDGEIEMIGKQSVRIYDGPKIIMKEYEDVLCPPRSANLRIPGPSNPGGATHVILVDHPSVDEIQRLVKSDFYDLVSTKDMKRILEGSDNQTEEEVKDQKDVFQGTTKALEPDDDTHKTLTRYLCFDVYDLDKNGENIDMMWWVLKEPKLLLKAKVMTEMYPADPPRRPLAEANLIPVAGRREGIGLLEMLETTHDLKKQIFDQGIDAGTLQNMPFGFYRATSNIKPEVMRMLPGDMMPLSDPQSDVHFPNLSANNSQAFTLNIMSMADAMQEKLTVRGDLQLGRVPIGRSSALRTSQNLQSLMAAGEARPERILRRFMMMWIEIFAQIHELNQHFLPEQKKFRIMGITDPRKDPYREVEVLKDLKGRFQFDFSVNVLNASKIAQQDSLEKLMSVYSTELMLTLGISTPETIYRMALDWGRAHGQRPEKYINEPSPDASLPPILAEEALTQIMGGQMPQGTPMEGPQQHMAKLQQFIQSDQMAFMDSPGKITMLRTYMSGVAQRIKQEEIAKAAGVQGQGSGGSAQGAGGPPPDTSQPQVQDNELLDESLPTAGGGGNGALQGAQ